MSPAEGAGAEGTCASALRTVVRTNWYVALWGLKLKV